MAVWWFTLVALWTATLPAPLPGEIAAGACVAVPCAAAARAARITLDGFAHAAAQIGDGAAAGAGRRIRDRALLSTTALDAVGDRPVLPVHGPGARTRAARDPPAAGAAPAPHRSVDFLHEPHSGHAGDYVAWLLLGVTALAALVVAPS
ncbi:hypothetical protein GCM10010470_21320 [Saccharopolyspora taberi]|uniref:Uncharacterized protein n=1 Tax=Saccharopolyspora taberi TaxID=60895 RepID=A0ABN3VB60_9PSEU